MPSYSFAESAEDDLTNIVQFTLENWGPDQALAYIDGLEKLAASIADNPGMGNPCDKLEPGLRAFPYESHTLYYLTHDQAITVIRVLHQSMNAALHFGE